MTVRISGPQKQALLEIHFAELEHGLNAMVETSRLRLCASERFDKRIAPNHFYVGMTTLMKHGYLSVTRNTNREHSSLARSNEFMWMLTDKGRAYAETLHSAILRPKRSYIKSRRRGRK